MGTRLTLDKIPNPPPQIEVEFNRHSELAFNQHLRLGLVSQQFSSFSLLGDVVIKYRTKTNAELDSNDYREFSLFATEEFVNQILNYAETEFPHDYGHVGLADMVAFAEDVRIMKDFVKEVDFNTHLLIITHM